MQDLNVVAQNLLNRFCRALDSSQYDQLLACFSANGTWLRMGKPLTGHAEILRELTDNRPATLKTIHLVSNVVIDRQEGPVASEQDALGQSASGQFYMVAYRQDSAAPPPYPMPKPTVIGVCPVEIVRTQEGWLLKFLQVGPFLFAS